jgi:RNA polymerase primary sigma factor
MAREPISMESPLGHDGVSTLGDLLEDRSAVSPSEVAMSANLVDEIRRSLAFLPPREARILRLRFGIEGGGERTLEQVGAVYGLTRERIRQIEAKALKRLRAGHAVARLRSLIQE